MMRYLTIAFFVATAAATAAVTRVIEIHRSPTCSCCKTYEAVLRAAGWTVTAIEEADMSAFKTSHGLPPATWSCHTGLVAGYVVEGHVPLAALERLLAERPSVDAIALPGMPAGAPGQPGTKAGKFNVVSVTDGRVTPFASY